MIKAASPMGIVGATITLGIDVQVDHEIAHLNLLASICHNNKAALEETYCVGVAFKNLTQQDRLVLHYATQGPPN
jgi:hypothetical protein